MTELEEKYAEAFDAWFMNLLCFSTDSCHTRDILRGQKRNLFHEFIRLEEGGEPKLQSIYSREE